MIEVSREKAQATFDALAKQIKREEAEGNPAIMRSLTTVGLRSKPLMEWTLKVMANLLDPDEARTTEHIYNAIERTVNVGN